MRRAHCDRKSLTVLVLVAVGWALGCAGEGPHAVADAPAADIPLGDTASGDTPDEGSGAVDTPDGAADATPDLYSPEVDTGDTGDTGSCAPGSAGCACVAGACPGGAGLHCVAGICQTSCPLGTLGCACELERCGLSDAGEQLQCRLGSCALPDCVAGSAGCACEAGSCAEGLECAATSGVERCEVAGCTVGAAGCGCTLTRACVEGAACVLGRCVAVDCVPGTEGCACTAAFGCNMGLRCRTSDGLCAGATEPACTPGNLGCACLEGETCVGELLCSGGQCQPIDCPAGLEGCACLAGACGLDAAGQPLSCTAGICSAPACPPGATGCVCRNGATCLSAADTCLDGYCALASCIPGTALCECIAGTCNPGLTCRDQTVCIDNAGLEGGPCLPNGLCQRNNRCDYSAGSPRCVFCDLGSQACQCRDDGTCSAGLVCEAGLCVGDDTVFDREPPADPQCYTPCAGPYVTTLGTEPCDSGLMRGCFGGLQCINGSCVEPGEDGTECLSDTDCPSFQLCMRGYCYSDCRNNADCPPGYACSERVCRLPCSLSSATCPAGTLCESADGQNGFCVTADPGELELEAAPAGQWSISERVLEFSNVSLSRTFVLHNNTNDYVTFTLRKAEHHVLFADGTSDTVRLIGESTALGGECTADQEEQDCGAGRVCLHGFCNCEGPADCAAGYRCLAGACRPECNGADCPLWWLEFGEFGAITGDDEVSVRAAPRCVACTASPCDAETACPVVTVRIADGGEGVDAVRWRGVIEVASTVGADRIQVSYVRTPEGQWAGKMVYFSTFGSAGIDSTGSQVGWIDRDDKGNVDGVRNGLIQRWGAFRNGLLTGGFEEFQAVLGATQSGAWNWPSVRQSCIAPNGACYLFDAGAGALPKIYVTALSDAPIPSGATELPMALNLYVPDPNTAPQTLRGRVVSETALHYAGNPEVQLSFEADPADARNCDPRVHSNCVVFLQDLSARIIVGGRYHPRGAGAACDPAYAGYEQRTVPWLVPGFLGDAAVDPATGLYNRSDCVDGRLPYWGTEQDDERSANLNLALGNPIPDGAVRERTIELLDGAIIDQNALFVLFRERYPSFLVAGEDLTAYGFMLLRRQPAEISPADADGDLVPDGYEGSVPPGDVPAGPPRPGPTCSASRIGQVLGAGQTLSADNAHLVIEALLAGGPADADDALDPAHVAQDPNREEVHYLCVDTGLIDGGPGNTAAWGQGAVGPNNNSCNEPGCDGQPCVDARMDCTAQCLGQEWPVGTPWADKQQCIVDCVVAAAPECINGCYGAFNGFCEDGLGGSESSECAAGTDLADCGFRYTDTRAQCPDGSEVLYFTTRRDVVQGDYGGIHALPCQQNGTCLDAFNAWRESGWEGLLQVDPAWRCSAAVDVFCDDNRLDLRYGKTFFRAAATRSVPLRPRIQEAFRYKTRFLSRDSGQIGFTPEICRPYSGAVPYCYDPTAIEAIRGDVDCLLDIYGRFYAGPGGPSLPQAGALYDYLDENFSFTSDTDPLGGLAVEHDGFERSQAELLIMLGDEAYTRAFASRFDLAGSTTASFEGSRFEPDGIDLSGVAGFELASLYQASQYYDLVLERFYGMAPVFAATLAAGPPTSDIDFISVGTVTSYFDRVIRASTQKARAWSQIAKRYQSFNRADLGRRVAVRAYGATYLESVALTNVILRVYDVAGGSNRPQLLQVLDQAQKRYAAALLELQTVNRSLSDDVGQFGYAPDYIPFPALDSVAGVTTNAFEVVLGSVESKLGLAAQREAIARESSRTFDTDQAAFQAELARLVQTYDAQLASLCGTFTAPDGRVYPATERYAYLDPRLSVLGAPCGLVGNGQIHQAIGRVDVLGLAIQQTIVDIENVFASVEIERQRVSEQCGLIVSLADYNYAYQGQLYDMELAQASMQFTVERVKRTVEKAVKVAEMQKCEGPAGCAAVPGLMAAAISAFVMQEGVSYTFEQMALEAMAYRNQLTLENAYWNRLADCDFAQINANATTAAMLLALADHKINLLRGQYEVALAMSEVGRLFAEARRLEIEQDENVQLTLDVQAARNDPNVRIYKNDAIVNADIAFQDALRAAYRLTLVYEYYTSRRYEKRDELFLIRMVSSGDYNLENYVVELQNAFATFEEEFGIPDTRVMLVSLRDDILAVPRVDERGRALTIEDRARVMRERLRDPKYLDSHGYLAVPFRTRSEDLSPLTRNHKVLYVEANIEGNDNGDFLGRLYLSQTGTGVVRTVDGETNYFKFPDRTGVINPFFNSTRQFASSPEVYRNFRLRDRPLINTGWQLVFNQRDELVNRDINLGKLTDIKVYVFYTDFTAF